MSCDDCILIRLWSISQCVKCRRNNITYHTKVLSELYFCLWVNFSFFGSDRAIQWFFAVVATVFVLFDWSVGRRLWSGPWWLTSYTERGISLPRHQCVQTTFLYQVQAWALPSSPDHSKRHVIAVSSQLFRSICLMRSESYKSASSQHTFQTFSYLSASSLAEESISTTIISRMCRRIFREMIDNVSSVNVIVERIHHITYFFHFFPEQDTVFSWQHWWRQIYVSMTVPCLHKEVWLRWR